MSSWAADVAYISSAQGFVRAGSGTASTANWTGQAPLHGFTGYGAIQADGRCLSGRTGGQPLTREACRGDAAQKWALAGGRLNNEGGWCADVEGNRAGPGVRVLAFKCSGAPNQRWNAHHVQTAQVAAGAIADPKIKALFVETALRAPAGAVISLSTGKLVASGGGNLVASGGRFNAPGPRTCSTHKPPTRGAPSPEQARAYVICFAEGTYGSGPSLALVSQVHIEVGKGRPFNLRTDSFQSIDPTEMVYDIRGSLVSYNCGYGGANSCKRGFQRNGLGICFKSTFGDWQCTFYDRQNDIVKNPLVPPPSLEQAE